MECFKNTSLATLNNNLSLQKKWLWTGECDNGGTITVPNVPKYDLFMVMSSFYPVTLIGYKFGNSIYASGIDGNAPNGHRSFTVRLLINGDTLTLSSVMERHLFSGQHEATATFKITHIIGLM